MAIVIPRQIMAVFKQWELFLSSAMTAGDVTHWSQLYELAVAVTTWLIRHLSTCCMSPCNGGKPLACDWLHTLSSITQLLLISPWWTEIIAINCRGSLHNCKYIRFLCCSQLLTIFRWYWLKAYHHLHFLSFPPGTKKAVKLSTCQEMIVAD